nr:hypothetical protein [Tanacetum cinerariifolium]
MIETGFGALTGEATGSMIGATTGSEFRIGDLVRTTGGWMSLVLPLVVGCTVSLVGSVSRSTIGGEEVVGIVGPGYAVPLRVVIPFKSSFGLVIVLPGRVPEPEDEAAEESGVNELELGKPELDKLEVCLTLVSSLEELVPSLVVPLRIMVSLIPVLVMEVPPAAALMVSRCLKVNPL